MINYLFSINSDFYKVVGKGGIKKLSWFLIMYELGEYYIILKFEKKKFELNY